MRILIFIFISVVFHIFINDVDARECTEDEKCISLSLCEYELELFADPKNRKELRKNICGIHLNTVI
jgi:hypothetical protein